jgi:hypothetical protein
VLDEPVEMAAQARRCRRLMRTATGQMRETLRLLAADYDQRRQAAENEAGGALIVSPIPGSGRI